MPGTDFNYFNYFTEVEERFQQARGTALYLMSPLDWALVESWKDQGVPLEAVLRGIDEAFEKWKAKKSKTSRVNSIAYCAQSIMEAARRLQDTPRTPSMVESPFESAEVEKYLLTAIQAFPTGFESVVQSIEAILADLPSWLEKVEELENMLSTLEDKCIAILRARCNETRLFEIKLQVAERIKPYRAKLSAADLMLTEQKLLDKLLLENSAIPRLSLFYLSA